MLLGDDRSLEHLNPLPVAFLDPQVDTDGVTHCDVGGCLLRHVLLNKIFHEIHCLFPPVIQVFMGKFPMHALGACPRGPPFFHRRRIFYQVAEQIASINCKVFQPAPEIPLTFPRISCSFFLFASGGQGRLPGSTSLAPVRET